MDFSMIVNIGCKYGIKHINMVVKTGENISEKKCKYGCKHMCKDGWKPALLYM